MADNTAQNAQQAGVVASPNQPLDTIAETLTTPSPPELSLVVTEAQPLEAEDAVTDAATDSEPSSSSSASAESAVERRKYNVIFASLLALFLVGILNMFLAPSSDAQSYITVLEWIAFLATILTAVLTIYFWTKKHWFLVKLTLFIAIVLDGIDIIVKVGLIARVLLPLNLSEGNVQEPSSVLPITLLSVVSLWLINIIVFAIVYALVDDCGVHQGLKEVHKVSFVFPAYQYKDGNEELEDWTPHFVDYLFLSFNTSATFGTSDTVVRSATAKWLLMIQAIISLIITVGLISGVLNQK